jgi:hypothetical protein
VVEKDLSNLLFVNDFDGNAYLHIKDTSNLSAMPICIYKLASMRHFGILVWVKTQWHYAPVARLYWIVHWDWEVSRIQLPLVILPNILSLPRPVLALVRILTNEGLVMVLMDGVRKKHLVS